MKAISKKSALNRMDWFDFLNYFIMLLVIVCTVFPLYYCAIVSISNGAAVTKGEVVFAPVGFDTTAYKVVFGNSQILRSYGNTIYYTLLGTAINIALTVLCAYPLSRPTLKGRKALNFLFMLTMFINGGMIPMYLQVKSLGMLDTVWSIVLPGAISTYNMIIMRSFFSSIPEARHEAAEIDGADHFQTLFRVVLPLSQTILATLVLFYAVGHWNSYLSALLYLSDTKKMPFLPQKENISALKVLLLYPEINLSPLTVAVLPHITASAAEPESSTDRLANQVKKYIEDHFQEELSLDILADKMEISPKYLSRIFKQSIGVNLSEYLMYIRIENAKKMLLADMSMKDVMEKIGMNNRTTFTRAFKRLEGITPNEYRILHKQIV